MNLQWLTDFSFKTRNKINRLMQNLDDDFAHLSNKQSFLLPTQKLKIGFFDAQFPGNLYELGIIENDIWSSRIWAITDNILPIYCSLCGWWESFLGDIIYQSHNEITSQDFYQVRSRWWLIWLMSWRQLSRVQRSGRSSFLFRLKTFFVLDRWLYISRLCTMLLDSIKTLEFIKTMFWPNTNACFLILNDVVPPKGLGHPSPTVLSNRACNLISSDS